MEIHSPRGSVRRLLIEGGIVTLLLALAGFFYLRPASSELLRGNASVMVGDGTDSVTNPWQYRIVLDLFLSRPQDLIFGAVYSDQINAPEGALSFIPWIERVFVLLFAPFMSTDLMPTAMAWALMVFSGLCFHAYGRVLGWPRVIAFALSLAWAFSPFTRARATVHIGMVGTYWAPMLFMALTVLARPPRGWSTRRATMAASGMMLLAVTAGAYYVLNAAFMAPVFTLYYALLLPRSASRIGAAGRLALAVAPAVVFLVFGFMMRAPSYGTRALANVVTTRSETAHMLKGGGAHPTDYIAGDVKLGDRDLLPLRSKVTRATIADSPYNRHERTNGIRWSVLAACACLAVALGARRFRRRLSQTERRLGAFAFILAASAFLLALSPQGLRVYDVDLGPVQIAAKIFPPFRVPNRVGLLVQFAALLGAGVFLARVLRKPLGARSRGGLAAGAALPLLMILDYAPLHQMPLAAIPRPRKELEVAGGCGSGMAVPYTAYGIFDEDYYRMMTEVRGTSCKILHTTYLTREDEILRYALSVPTHQRGERLTAERMARCAGASWVVFRLDASEELKRSFCADMGWSFVSPDSCRASSGTPLPPTRSLRECIEQLGISADVVPRAE
jgi:hypothetical protein